MELDNLAIYAALNDAQRYADANSTCAKVRVGSLILRLTEDKFPLMGAYGCNHGVNECTKRGCRRIKLYGEASKNHRLPSDCDAIHSEIDAIAHAAHLGIDLTGATIFVTRYPCEACARAIAESGITTVYYGRQESVSEYTMQILDGIRTIHVSDWDREDNHD